MSIKYSQSFKIQAVEKALNRAEGIEIKHLAESLSVTKREPHEKMGTDLF